MAIPCITSKNLVGWLKLGLKVVLADADDYYQSYIVPDYTKDGCDMYWRVRNKRELMYMNRVNK